VEEGAHVSVEGWVGSGISVLQSVGNSCDVSLGESRNRVFSTGRSAIPASDGLTMHPPETTHINNAPIDNNAMPVHRTPEEGKSCIEVILDLKPTRNIV
jgi:hypothetical protein